MQMISKVMDSLTKEKRSWNMAQIKSRDTKPELIVRKLLHRLGYRFRLHRTELPGCPDIILPKYRTVVLVHGCFWHRHTGCQFAYNPKSRVDFWEKKFRKNVKRDKKVRHELIDLGWRVLIIWECEVKNYDRLVQRIKKDFEPNTLK